MQPDRWKEVKAMVKKQFPVEYDGLEAVELGPGTREILEFETPEAGMRLEFITKPRQLGRRVHSSGRRSSGNTNEQILYSDTEVTHYLEAYRWDDAADDWVKMDSKQFE